MVLQTWNDYPQAGDPVSRSVFFQELKTNLVAVIQDYAGLGVNNEPQLIQEAQGLFTGEIVPSKDDWESLTKLLHLLANEKEFANMYHDFIGDVSVSLGEGSLEGIRQFLDAIQRVGPQPPAVSIRLPEPNRPFINKPTFSSVDNFEKSIQLRWTLDSSSYTVKNAEVTGTPSRSEDVKQYDLTLHSGNKRWEKRFTPTQSITYSLPLDWRNWYADKDLSKASLSADLIAEDKRGNQTSTSVTVQYTSEVSIPTPIQTYYVEYQINGGSWVRIGQSATLSFNWTTLPRTDGLYRFRVRGIDTLGRGVGGKDGGTYWDWAYSDEKTLTYTPPPPEKPQPTYTSTWNTVTLNWKPCARATSYEVWNGDETWAKNNTKDGNVYWVVVPGTAKLEAKIHSLRSDATHQLKVRAVGPGGKTTAYISCKTKARVLQKKTYSTMESRVWRGMYDFMNANGYVVSHNSPNWRTEKGTIYQGEWKEVKLGGWRQRGGNGAYYMAYDGQTWGNHMSFIFFDYVTMRNQLRGKSIQKVTLTFRRETSGLHGFASAQPLYVYNHNRDNSSSTTTENAFTLFHPLNKKAVTNTNAVAVSNVQFNRGETESIANDITKALIQNIVDGSMRGLGIVKYYGSLFNTHTTYSDKTYMRLSDKVTITVEYYDN